MDDRKKESQKTVVAFVAGLLIGGLLVWVFSQSPENATTDTNNENETETSEEVELGENDDEEENEAEENTPATPEAPTSTPAASNDNASPAATVVAGDFTFSVDDQEAGTSVELSETSSYPTTHGWVVVHEDANGELGNALGAARYNTDAGLTPERVVLLRGTEAGMTYHVVYYSENGDRVFDLRTDAPLTNDEGVIRTTFTAQ